MKVAATLLFIIFTPAELASAQINSNWFSNSNASPGCSDELTRSAVLQSDIVCDCTERPALALVGSGIVLEMNGHSVSCGDGSRDNNFDPWEQVGINVGGKNNRVVGPGNVTESRVGIVLDGEGGHNITNVFVNDIGNVGIRVLSDFNTIEKSIVALTEFDGMQVDGDRNTIRNNDLIDVDANTITLYGSYNVVQRNHISSPTVQNDYGIESRDGAFGNRILHNVITDIYDIAIYLSNGGGHEIRGNEIFESGVEGGSPSIYVFNQHDVHVLENHIANCDGAIRIGSTTSSSTPSTNIVVERNIITGNAGYGVYLKYCENCHVMKNTVNNNDRIGLQLDRGCSDVSLIDNIVTKNGMQGVKISSASPTNTGIVVSRNTIWGNVGEELDNDVGANTIIVGDNTIET